MQEVIPEDKAQEEITTEEKQRRLSLEIEIGQMVSGIIEKTIDFLKEIVPRDNPHCDQVTIAINVLIASLVHMVAETSAQDADVRTVLLLTKLIQDNLSYKRNGAYQAVKESE